MRTDSTITIFNRKVVERRERFLPTIISGVTWYGHSGMGTTNDSSDSFKVRIPLTSDRSGKDYVDAADFKALTLEETQTRWTIQKGDFVVRGSFDQEISSESDLTSASADVFVVSMYADNTIRGSEQVKHWLIGGA